MGLTQFSLQNRTVVFVMVALLSIAGIAAYAGLPRSEDPGFLVRTAVVAAVYPGASAERVERQVAIPFEEALEELPGAENVRVEVTPGRAVIYVDVVDTLPAVEPTWTELRETVADVMPTLPPGVRGPFINDDFGDVYGTVLSITGEGYETAELEQAAEILRRRVLTLDDARRVQIDGARERQVTVEVDPARLAALGVPTGYLIGQLQSRNLVAPGGDVTADGRTLQLRTGGAFASVEDVRETALRLPAGEIVALGDLATVREGYAEPGGQRVRYNGQEAVTLAVSMREDGKLTEFGPQVLAVVEEARADLPAGLDVDMVVYQPAIVDAIASEFVSSLIQSIFIVIGVLLLTLGVRTGLVVAASVPIVMFASFIAMQAFGISINQMSLTALIVALGLLVDNAIVVAEQILNDIQAGRDKREAAVEAVRELSFPLVVASASTAAALLPTYLAESASSEYVAALFEVLSVSLAVSWLLAVTLIPVLCVLFLKAGRPKAAERTPIWRRLAERVGLVQPRASEPAGAQQESAGDGPYDTPYETPYETPLYRRYRATLVPMLRRKWLSLGVFVAVLVASFAAFGALVPQQFFPNKSYDVFYVELEMPRGTSLEEADRVAADYERFLADSLAATPAGPPPALGEAPTFADEGVARWAAYVGSAPPRFTLSFTPKAPRPGYAYFIMTASSPDEQQRIFERTLAYMNRAHPDVVTRPGTIQNGPPVNYPIELRLLGDDPTELEQAAAGVRTELRSTPGVVNVNTDWGARAPALDVAVDHAAARRAGLSTADVSLSLQTALDGVPLTALQDGDDLVPVVLRSTDALAGAEALDRLELFSQQTGQSVPFGQVATSEVVYEPGLIQRYNGQRALTVRADLSPSAGLFVTPFSVQADLDGYLDEARASWAPGVTSEYGGIIEESVDSQNAINAKGPIALVVILLLLVLQFNALREPLIVLLTLPFAFVGTTLGMLVSGYAFGFMPLLGTIALIGILINNAVVLLDRLVIERRRGLAAEQAVLHASQQRLRPILLTAATTSAGLIPLWVAGSPLFAPMAVALLFGLVIATALTPGLVPVLYALVYRLDFSEVEYDPDPERTPEAADVETYAQEPTQVTSADEPHGDGAVGDIPVREPVPMDAPAGASANGSGSGPSHGSPPEASGGNEATGT